VEERLLVTVWMMLIRIPFCEALFAWTDLISVEELLQYTFRHRQTGLAVTVLMMLLLYSIPRHCCLRGRI